MAGFAVPEMRVQVCNLQPQGRTTEASDLFDIRLPLVRHEPQRGILASAHIRRPVRELDLHETAQAGRLIDRQRQRLQEMH